LRGSGWELAGVAGVSDAIAGIVRTHPRAVVVDLRRELGEWGIVRDLVGDPATSGVPVLAVSAIDDRGRALRLGAVAWAQTPITRAWLTSALREAAGAGAAPVALVVDDDPVARYVARQRLEELGCAVSEAEGGVEGIARARHERPDVIVLDLVMPDRSGFEVLEALENGAETRDIPVVVLTSTPVDDTERRRLAMRVVTVLTKDTVGYSLPEALRAAWQAEGERSVA
jgi:CheY-like chemotaxis protein